MQTIQNKLKKNKGQIALHIVFVLISIIYIVPLMLVISASFSSEEALLRKGFNLFPQDFTMEGYFLVFKNPAQILQSYATTFTYSIAGTFLSVLIMGVMGYPLARENFRLKKLINFIALFTMLFGGGLVPSYILNARYLHLDNTIWIYILPGLVSAYNLFVIKAGYKSVPDELIEAAKIDGASEVYICFNIMMPLAKATLATVAFLTMVGKWNDWFTSSVYIENPKLYSLQYLLQRILNETQYLKQLAQSGMVVMDESELIPIETLRYAMAMVAAGPMLVIFPFFQKYFVKGMTIGAVKG